MITRDKAYAVLKNHVRDRFLINHHRSAEVVMRAFALYYKEDPELWGICGLIHDLDWESTKSAPERHTQVAAEILRAEGFDEVIIRAMRAHHPSASGVWPVTLMEKVLYTTEELTGLIMACALVRPDKSLKSVQPESVLRKLKDKAFARGVNRDVVGQAPEAMGLSMEMIVAISLQAMQEIASELGL